MQNYTEVGAVIVPQVGDDSSTSCINYRPIIKNNIHNHEFQNETKVKLKLSFLYLLGSFILVCKSFQWRNGLECVTSHYFVFNIN